jgi:predicted transcriptional regulator
MKTTTIPPLRVSRALRRRAEAVLENGESLSSFMLQALEASIGRRTDQQAFVARGLASAASARRTGRYVSADAVVERLAGKLSRASKPRKPR